MYDLQAGRELLAAPTEIALYDDTAHDTWAHGEQFSRDRVPYTVTGETELIERGPVRATVRTRQQFGNSTLIRDYSLYADSDTADVRVKIDFHEQFRVLKFRFPLATCAGKAYNAIPFGHIERPTDGSELFADHYGERDAFCEFMEQGEHRFSYRFHPFSSFADAQRRADELEFPLIPIQETFHAGKLPTEFAGMELSAQHVSVTAVKGHEDSDGVILRFFETQGDDTALTVRLLDSTHTLHLSHNSVRTLLWRGDRFTETDFIE